MSQRTERMAGEVRAIVGEVIARQEIKDPRVRGAGLITVTHVRISGDLRHGRILFTVHNAGEAELERVREGLGHASGYLRQVIGRRLRTKVSPELTFEIDRVFEQAERVEGLLREVAASQPPAPVVVAEESAEDPAAEDAPAEDPSSNDPSSNDPPSDDEPAQK
jgi:ribosome-binding factor A